MGALNAILAIRHHVVAYPSINPKVAIETIARTDADLAGSDLEAGLDLHELLPDPIRYDDPTNSLREAIAFLISFHRPSWSNLLRLGRRHVTRALGRNESQCIRSAGLLEDPPSDMVIAWWDRLAQNVHALRSSELLVQGRRAERLSLGFERVRLRGLGIGLEPQLVSLEDNTVGYDILSYNPGPVQPVARLVEVKSSTANPPSFIITRNEWNAALRAKEAYVFQFWDLKSEVMYERTVSDMQHHIPVDQGAGMWRTIEIPLKELRTLT